MSSIKDVLMHRDGMSESEAELAVQSARDYIEELISDDSLDHFQAMMDAEEYLRGEFGLEPDYLMELMP